MPHAKKENAHFHKRREAAVAEAKMHWQKMCCKRIKQKGAVNARSYPSTREREHDLRHTRSHTRMRADDAGAAQMTDARNARY